MKRHGQAHRCLFARWQQEPIATEIVEADAPKAELVEQPSKAGKAQQLTRQQMMPLHCAVVSRRAYPVTARNGRWGRLPLSFLECDLSILG